MRAAVAALAVALAAVVTACGSSSPTPAAAPPAQPGPEPGGATTTAAPSPGAQPPPSQPPPPQPPAPTPGPTGAPTTAAPSSAGPTIRWAVSAPGVFWVGMDDAGARWSAADLNGALRLEKRDRDGRLLWSGTWTHHGSYALTAAVTPAGEAMFAASSACSGAPGCGDTFDVDGTTFAGSVVVKLQTDGLVRWTRALDGRLVGGDASGGAALAGWRPAGSTARYVAKLDANGAVVWSRLVTSTLSARLARTGDVLLAGCYQSDAFLVAGIPCDGAVAARIGADGTVAWTARLRGFWPSLDTAADGTGYAVSFGGQPFVLTAIAPDGAIRWFRQVGAGVLATQRGDPLLVAAAANGPVVVSSYAYVPDASGALASRAALLGFDAAGGATFVDVVEALWPPAAIVYGADGELLVAAGGGAIDAPGGHVDGPMLVELTP